MSDHICWVWSGEQEERAGRRRVAAAGSLCQPDNISDAPFFAFEPRNCDFSPPRAFSFSIFVGLISRSAGSTDDLVSILREEPEKMVASEIAKRIVDEQVALENLKKAALEYARVVAAKADHSFKRRV